MSEENEMTRVEIWDAVADAYRKSIELGGRDCLLPNWMVAELLKMADPRQ